MDILCLDSEQEFVQSLESAGYAVHQGELGYKSGKCRIETPPHEVDAMVFNLEKPACFDSMKWGSGNDNFNCEIEPSLTDEILVYQSGDREYEESRYQLIFDRQIRKSGSRFRAEDIVKAITAGGIPLFVFLNDAYLKYVGQTYGNVPNFFDIDVRYAKTSAMKLEINDDFAEILPAFLKVKDTLKLPLKYKIESSQRGVDFLYNNIGDVFSKIIWHKGGLVWLLPEYHKNNVALDCILQKLSHLKGFVLSLMMPGQRSPGVKPKSVIIDVEKKELNHDPGPLKRNDEEGWDLFICHAGEDKKEFVEPLCNALISRKSDLKIWYDKFVLKLGDNLRRKIEEGLKKSRYGIVILSPSFFEKVWPQNELDGLFSLEQNGQKRIIPIWHKVEEPDVRKYSPILALRYAAKTNEGLDVVVTKILDAIAD